MDLAIETGDRRIGRHGNRHGSSISCSSRYFGLLVSGVAALMLAACGEDAAPAPTSPPGGGAVRTLVRTCETAARGSAPEFRQLTTASPAAAIVFVGLQCADCRAGPVTPEQRDPSYYEPFGNGRFRLNKVLVGVATGSTVTVIVPEAERSRVALLYDTPLSLSADGLYAMTEGESQVTFEACDDPNTGFPGEFLVAGPRCVELEVHLGDAVDRVLLPFGVDDCGE
jgi:hypothetical protein